MIACPMFNDTDCRFASLETRYSAYTGIKMQDHHYVPTKVGYKQNVIGVRCNNDGTKMVSDIHYCPARWGLHSVTSTGIRADGCGEYKDSQIIPDAFVAVGTGQQTLQI